MHTPRILLIILLLFFCFSLQAQVIVEQGNITASIYIATNGSDTNTGSINAPLATFFQAVNQLDYGMNGDTIYSEIVFLPGTYQVSNELRQACWQYDNGAGYKAISLRGTHRDSVIIDGSSATYQSGNFIELLGSKIFLKDLTIKLASDTDTTNFWAAVDFNSTVSPCNTNTSNNVLIQNIKIDGSWDHGINIDMMEKVKVENCEVINTNLTNINGRNDNGNPLTWGSGIKTRLSQEIEISNCIVHNCWGEGIANARTEDVYVHHNEIYDNYSVNIYMDNVIDGTYTNNLCYGTLGDPTYWRGSGPSPGFGVAAEYYSSGADFAKSENIKIYNNIVLNSQGLFIDDNRKTTEPRNVDFSKIWFCNNSIVGWQGDNTANPRMIRIDYADYNNGYISIDSIFIFNNLIAVTDDLVAPSGNGQLISGTNQPQPVGLFYGYNYWSVDPQRYSFYTYPFDPNTDNINYNIPLQTTPNMMEIIQPTDQNNLMYSGQAFSFIQDDYYNDNRAGNYNIGAMLPYISLPIELLSFEASFIHDNNVILKWITSSEMNNDYFTVEKSLDNIEWQELGQVKGAGYSMVEKDYSLLDTKTQNGVNYYRLKQTDFGGTCTYSKIISIEIENPVEINVFPNPSSDFIIIRTKEISENTLEIELLDLKGKLLKTIKILQGSRIGYFDIQTLDDGVYIIRIREGNNVVNKKVIISH